MSQARACALRALRAAARAHETGGSSHPQLTPHAHAHSHSHHLPPTPGCLTAALQAPLLPSPPAGPLPAPPAARAFSGRPHPAADTNGAQPPFSATELAGLAAKLADSSYAHAPAEAVPSAGLGPLLAYTQGREEGLLRPDPLQEATIQQLQRLYEDLVAAIPAPAGRRGASGLTLVDAAGPGPGAAAEEGRRPWWTTLFGSLGTDLEASAGEGEPAVQGLYMHGGVGCGKTMLMDLFAACAPPHFKLLRTHFHDFMLDVHGRLRAQAGAPDPLARVADEVAAAAHVLCLDELFVTDVADAMILHRLFGRLWDRGVVLVATSNRRPDALYEGGLQRALFMPFIERLKSACVIHDMVSPTDYRRLAQHRSGLYFVSREREAELEGRFLELANHQPVGPQEVEVAMGRRLRLPRVGGCITAFTFDELCGRPRGAADYIALANAKHTVALSGVPVFTAANRTAAYRFVTLIDVLYEHRVRLLCSAEAAPAQLFAHVLTNEEAKKTESSGPPGGGDAVVDDNLGFSKDRTVSRLTEMQSREYLRAHAERHAPELLYALEEGERRETDTRAAVARG